MATPTYTKSGNKATTAAKLPKEVFAVDSVNHELLKQAYNAYLANGRIASATTKTRGEVRGGGKKPWKQKGTGRARFGSSRVPIWRGGGITFGPTGEQNYTQKLPTETKRRAIRQALTLKTKNISVIEAFDTKGKTAEAAKLLNKIEATRNVLVVVEAKTEEMTRATNNLQNVKVSQARYLNVFDILNADSIVLTAKSVDIIAEWLGGKKSSVAKAKEDK